MIVVRSVEIIFFMVVFFSSLQITFCRFAMGGIFTTNVHSEDWTFCNHKCVIEARHPAYCKCAVMPSPFFFCRPIDCHFSCLDFVSFIILKTENICPLMKIKKKVEITGITNGGSFALSLSSPATGIIWKIVKPIKNVQ